MKTLAALVLAVGTLVPALQAQTTWTAGNLTNVWNDPGNWDSGVPTGATDAIIPSSASIFPGAYTSSPSTANLTIQSSASMTLGGGFDLTVTGDLLISGTLTVSSSSSDIDVDGDWTNDGTFTSSTATVELSGTGVIAGTSATSFFDLVVSGARTVTTGFTATGNVELASGGSLAIGATTLTVTGDWVSSGAGNTVTGTGTVTFVGTGAMTTGSNSLPNVLVSGGTRTLATSVVVGDLELTGGSIVVGDSATVTVGGDLLPTAGTLGWSTTFAGLDVLDVAGSVIVGTASVGTTSSDSRLRVAGNWSSGATWDPGAGTTELDGGTTATIAGAGPNFFNLRIVDGDKNFVSVTDVDGTLVVENGAAFGTTASLDVAGTVTLGDNTASWDAGDAAHVLRASLLSSGADVTSTTGLALLEFVGSGATSLSFPTGSLDVPNVTLTSGTLTITTVTVNGDLTMNGGTLNVLNNQTVTVTGDADLLAGTLSFQDITAGIETVDVAGNVTLTAAAGTMTVSSRIECAGDWTSTAAWTPAFGTVAFDGAGTATVDGTNFRNVAVESGTANFVTAAALTGALTISSGATLDADAALDVNGAVTLGNNTSAWDLGASTHTVAGSYTSSGGSATSGSTGKVQFDGSGNVSTGGGSIASVLVSAGLRVASTTDVVGDLSVSGGTLTVANDASVTVGGDLLVTGGTLAWTGLADAGLDVLDVAGNASLGTTAAGTTTASSRMRVAGDFTSDGSFAPGAGTVELDGPGGSSIAGAAPTFFNLRLVSDRSVDAAATVAGDLTLDNGVTLTSNAAVDVNDDVSLGDNTAAWDLGNDTHTVAGDWVSAGASATSAGTGRVEFDGTGSLATGGGSIAAVLITAGTRTSADASITGDLELNGAGSILRIGNDNTLAVGGNADLLDGSIEWFIAPTGTPDVLDVEGDADVQVPVGTSTTDSRLRVAGNWSSTAAFAPAAGIVELDGGTTTTAAGPSFADLSVVSGSKTLSGTTVVSGDLRVEAGSTLTQLAASTDLDVSGDVVVEGTLALQDNDIQVAGHWTSSAGGAAVTGTATVDLTGTGTIDTGSNTVPNLLVSAGVRSAADTSVAGTLDVSSGATLDLLDNTTLAVAGDATLAAGSSLGFIDSSAGLETLDVGGNVSCAATSNGESANARFHCAGTWTSTSAWAPAAGEVVLDGGTTTTFGGTAPQVHDLRVASGVKTVTVATAIGGDLYVDSGATLDTDAALSVADDVVLGDNTALWDIGGLTHTVVNDWTSAGADATGLATGLIRFTAAGNVIGGGGSIENMETTAGNRLMVGADVLGDLTLTGGSLRIGNDALVTVGGDALLNAPGVLEFFGVATGADDVLDVAGDVIMTASSAASSTKAVFRAAGNWSSTSAWAPASGLVELDGGTTTTVGGTAPVFPSLTIASGTKTVTVAATITGNLSVLSGATLDTDAALDVAGGVTLGNGTAAWDTGALTHTLGGSFSSSGASATDGANGSTLLLDGSGVFATGGGTVDNVSVATGSHAFSGTTITGNLSMTGGALNIQDNQEVTVAGDASLTAGTLAFVNSSAGLETLDVEGDVTLTATAGATSGNTRFECAGNWTANGNYVPTAGTTRLDGAGLTTIGGVLAGDDVAFRDLVITGGVREAANDFDLLINKITIDPGAELRLDDKRMAVPGSTLLVNGDLTVGSGGELALGATAVMSVGSTGTLSVVGTAGVPARVAGEAGGGYFLTIDGTLEAGQFEFADMGASGVIVNQTATLGAFPNDLRVGTFTNPSATAGSTMLDIRRSSPTDLRYVDFEDPLSQGTFNVRTLGGSAITFTNSSGSLAGESFDDDPFDLVSWATNITVIVDFFATAGLDQVTLDWETFTEVDTDEFLIKRATNFGGPFTTIATVTATGAGSTYQHIDSTVVAGQFYVYQLIEKLNVGIEVFIAQRTATPWGAALPSNVLDVGPSGTYTDIGSAVTAAASVIKPVIMVAPGTYPAFTVGPTFSTLRIYGDGTGSVIVDTTTQPVQVLNLPASGVVHIADMEIGSAGTSNEGLLVQNCAGAVILDELSVTGGSGGGGKAAIRVDNSTQVAIDRTDLLGGTPSILVESGSIAYMQGGSLTDADVSGSSQLRTSSLSGFGQTVDGGSLIEVLTGTAATLDMPHFAGLNEFFTVTLTGAANGNWFLFFSFDAGFIDLRNANQLIWEHVFMIDFGVGDLLLVSPIGPTGTASFPAKLPPNGILLGLPIVTQFVLQDTGTLQQRLSNVATIIGMPQ